MTDETTTKTITISATKARGHEDSQDNEGYPILFRKVDYEI